MSAAHGRTPQTIHHTAHTIHTTPLTTLYTNNTVQHSTSYVSGADEVLDVCGDEGGARVVESDEGRDGALDAQRAHLVQEEHKVSGEAQQLGRTDAPARRRVSERRWLKTEPMVFACTK